MSTLEMPDFGTMTRRQIEDYLIERAMADPEFRRAFLKDPKETLVKLGLPVGPEVEVSVIEEKPKAFFIVVPRILYELDELEELGDDELDDMQGGMSAQPDTFRFFKGYH